MISAVSLKRKQTTTLLWCLSTDISACHLKKGMPDFHAEQLVQNRVFYGKKITLVRMFFTVSSLCTFCFCFDRLITLMLCVLWGRQSLTAMMEQLRIRKVLQQQLQEPIAYLCCLLILSEKPAVLLILVGILNHRNKNNQKTPVKGQRIKNQQLKVQLALGIICFPSYEII